MADLTFTRSNELDVTEVVGNTEAGIDFVDGWVAREMFVVDSGRIIVREVHKIERKVAILGLTVEHDLVAAEKS